MNEDVADEVKGGFAVAGLKRDGHVADDVGETAGDGVIGDMGREDEDMGDCARMVHGNTRLVGERITTGLSDAKVLGPGEFGGAAAA